MYAAGKRDDRCSVCGSTALNKNGKTVCGKQRHICLICGRQFADHSSKIMLKDKVTCESCGMPMHIYKSDCRYIRFRCSGYPECRTYKTIDIGEVNYEILHA